MHDSARPPWFIPSGQRMSRMQSRHKQKKTFGQRKPVRWVQSSMHTARRQPTPQMHRRHSRQPTGRSKSNMPSVGKPLKTFADHDHARVGHSLGAFFDPPARFFCIWEKCDAQGQADFRHPPPPAHSPAPNYSHLRRRRQQSHLLGQPPRQSMGRVVSETEPEKDPFPDK